MTGKRGSSGGPRPGAGRPTSTTKIKAGDQFATWCLSPDGRQRGLGEMWMVESVSRTMIVIRSSTGETYRLSK